MKKLLSLLAIILTAVIQIDCSSSRGVRLVTKDDCQILADKRVVTRSVRQPKVTHARWHQPVISSDVNRAETSLLFSDISAPVFYADAKIDVSVPIWLMPESEMPDQGHHEEKPPTNLTPSVQCTELRSDAEPAQRKADRTFIRDNSALNFFALTGLLSMAIISVFKRTAMKFSSWANKNPRTTRALIASLHTGTLAASYWTGYTLAAEGTQFTSIAAGTVAGITALAAAGSVVKQIRLANFTNDYLRHKLLHAAIFAGSAAMVCSIGNSNYTARNNAISLAGYTIPLTTPSSPGTTSYQETKNHVVQPDPPKKKNIGWQILTITLFVLATVVVAAGVCALTCEGYTAGAILLGVGVETLLVLLMNHILRKLSGETKEERAIRKSQKRSKVPVETK